MKILCNIVKSKLLIPKNVHYQRKKPIHLNRSSGERTTLLFSPSETNYILRANEANVDLHTKSAIKYYDANYLGSNNPCEDRSVHAKFLHNDYFLFGVYDGHGGWQCADTVNQRLFDYIALNLLTTQQLEDKVKWDENARQVIIIRLN
jgi:pyruvate dehydrogenase phosphatase